MDSIPAMIHSFNPVPRTMQSYSFMDGRQGCQPGERRWLKKLPEHKTILQYLVLKEFKGIETFIPYNIFFCYYILSVVVYLGSPLSFSHFVTCHLSCADKLYSTSLIRGTFFFMYLYGCVPSFVYKCIYNTISVFATTLGHHPLFSNSSTHYLNTSIHP